MIINHKYIILILLLIIACQSGFAQGKKKTLPDVNKEASKKVEKKIPDIQVPDTIAVPDKTPTTPVVVDTTKTVVISNDSIRGKSGMDSIVVYSAKDSVTFKFGSRTMRLRGESKLDYKAQKLEAEIIELQFKESLLDASGVKDSNRNIVGFPKFDDNGEIYVGERIKFNFKTKRGTISLGETEIQEGFYFGSKIKRVSDKEAFIKDGKYTTCDSPHPHYYFGSPEMKLIANDRIFLSPLIFYVEDMPILIVPIGLFFPTQSGRSSGLIVPSFYLTQNRGVNIKDIGYYFALSDYYDTKIRFDIFSKGGYSIKNDWQWALKDVMSGNLNLEYGETRWNPNDDFDKNFSLVLHHNQTLSPSENISANLNFATQNFYKNTTINQRQTATQDITSNASYSKSFQDGSSISLAYGRSQNITTSAYSQNSTFAYSLPQFKPLSKLLSPESVPGWVRDLNFNYSLNAEWNETKTLNDMSTIISADSTYNWQDTVISPKMYIQHRPSLSITPKLGHITIQPRISFSANNYFRRIKKVFNPADSTVQTIEERKFCTEYTYNYGVSLSTKLFGIIKPRIFGLNAIRHTLQPSISYNFTPDLSDPSLEFRDSYKDEKGNTVSYSRFEKDGGGLASAREAQTITYSVTNKFDAKVKESDTSEKNIELLTWDFNGSYDFTKENFRFSDVRMSFRTPGITIFSLSSSAAFSMYDYEKIPDPKSGENKYRMVDRFCVSSGNGLLRLTNFSLSLSANFSFDNLKIGTVTTASGDSAANKKDSTGLGERFAGRVAYTGQKTDIFGDSSPGYDAISLPINLNFNLNYSYGDPFYEQLSKRNISRSLNLSTTMNFNLTETWSFGTSLYYDFINMQLTNPVVNITKELHCWQLSINWNPIGAYKGFYLRFGIKSPQLQDLQYEKRSYLVY